MPAVNVPVLLQFLVRLMVYEDPTRVLLMLRSLVTVMFEASVTVAEPPIVRL